ncbi:MAG: hypothetical protein KJ063_25725 [Anaerolineae bacterium]|nr:hypothetical protein [Anaerolineae bacterium]
MKVLTQQIILFMVFTFILLISFAGCSSLQGKANQELPENEVQENDDNSEVLQTREACEEAEGEWAKAPLSRQEYCNLPTSDGGQICQNSSQCEGTCIAKEVDDNASNEVIGECSSRNVIFGCFYLVEDGERQFRCID